MRRFVLLVSVGAGLFGLLGLTQAAVAAGTITVTEGQAFSGKVVDIGSCTLQSATIYWGDGTATSTGTSDGAGGITGSHTYADERTANGNVSYTCSAGGSTQTAYFTATVKDAPLSSAGRDLSGAAGQPVSGVVMHFSDANPAATAGDFQAQIHWGDDSITAGTVTASPGGGFDVSGTHTYEAAGSFAVSTSVSDAGGSTGASSSAARISSPAPSPPPPVGAPPAAHFKFAPASPCRDQFVTFDASGSTAGGNPIRGYRWSFANVTKDGVAQNVEPLHSVFVTSFGEWASTLGTPTDKGVFGLQAVEDLYRPPVEVTLTVVDSAGRSDSTSQTISFADPHEALTLFLNYNPLNPAYGTWERLDNTPTPCDAVLDAESNMPFGGGVAILHNPSATLLGNQKAIGVTVQCADRKASCYGVLNLQIPSKPRLRRLASKAAARRGRGHTQSVGAATFGAPAGQTTTVKVKLNALGRRLVRAHKLPKLILRLGVFRPKGKLRITTRTVSLRQHR